MASGACSWRYSHFSKSRSELKKSGSHSHNCLARTSDGGKMRASGNLFIKSRIECQRIVYRSGRYAAEEDSATKKLSIKCVTTAFSHSIRGQTDDCCCARGRYCWTIFCIAEKKWLVVIANYSIPKRVFHGRASNCKEIQPPGHLAATHWTFGFVPVQ